MYMKWLITAAAHNLLIQSFVALIRCVLQVDPDDIRTPDVEELGETTRLYTLHCGIELNEPVTPSSAGTTAMTHNDKMNHQLWLKSKANR